MIHAQSRYALRLLQEIQLWRFKDDESDLNEHNLNEDDLPTTITIKGETSDIHASRAGVDWKNITSFRESERAPVRTIFHQRVGTTACVYQGFHDDNALEAFIDQC